MDIDFKCCEEILNDMCKKVEDGIFGYSKNDEKYFIAIKAWYLSNFNIELKQEWLVTTPVVGVALSLLKCLLKKMIIIVNKF